jgi:hypothetical protein
MPCYCRLDNSLSKTSAQLAEDGDTESKIAADHALLHLDMGVWVTRYGYPHEDDSRDFRRLAGGRQTRGKERGMTLRRRHEPAGLRALARLRLVRPRRGRCAAAGGGRDSVGDPLAVRARVSSDRHTRADLLRSRVRGRRHSTRLRRGASGPRLRYPVRVRGTGNV